MRSDSLPTPRETRLRLGVLDAGLVVAVLALMVGYLALLLDLSPSEWRSFAGVVAVFGVLTGLVG